MIYNLETIKNMRDLGGLKSENGKTIKNNLLFRCGELYEISQNDIDFLHSNNVKAIIDFRDLSECRIKKDSRIDGIDYYSFPALPPLNMPEDEKEREKFIAKWNEHPKEVFMNLYKELSSSSESTEAYTKFFEVILSLKGKAVLWHCTQGKDRTGVAAILLLTALGVSKEDCLKEYFLTNDVMKTEYENLVQSGISKEKLHIMKIVLFVMEECIMTYINELEKRYGSIKNYIINILHITEEEIIQLRKDYLE